MNDDAQEKAERLQSRQALHDIQFSQIKAAASPIRKQTNFEGAAGSSPTSNTKTPRRIGKENDLDAGHFVVGGNAITPMKRVPILANFEEWMKMATDNKINAANSWNFALIDYFHDLSLLKEGDGVNFQKASCTLDGCVKIYTSRVDSVATETGKLLSGLADSSTNKTPKNDNEDVDNGEEEIEDEDGVVQKRPKKRVSPLSRHFQDICISSSDYKTMGIMLYQVLIFMTATLRKDELKHFALKVFFILHHLTSVYSAYMLLTRYLKDKSYHSVCYISVLQFNHEIPSFSLNYVAILKFEKKSLKVHFCYNPKIQLYIPPSHKKKLLSRLDY